MDTFEHLPFGEIIFSILEIHYLYEKILKKDSIEVH